MISLALKCFDKIFLFRIIGNKQDYLMPNKPELC